MSGVLGAYADRRTWEVAAYLLLGLPLGVLGFVLLVTGFSLGLGLLVTLLGIPVGFALGQGYVLWSDRGAAEQGDALFVGAVGALVGLLFGYVATSFLETRRRNERG